MAGRFSNVDDCWEFGTVFVYFLLSLFHPDNMGFFSVLQSEAVQVGDMVLLYKYV